MKIGYLGTGVWGFALTSLLASKGYSITAWSPEGELVNILNQQKEHPRLPNSVIQGEVSFTTDLEEALTDIDFLVESVTSAGVRPVFNQVKEVGVPNCTITLTSKGIEQGTGKTLSEVVTEVIGESFQPQIGSISGPSFAKDVVRGLPTSVVASGYSEETAHQILETFTSPTFRVYPNLDIKGVSLCGALKNVIAIASGLSDGLNFGSSAKAALMTRGLHEICKLAVASGCKVESVYGLAGMGDLCLTCSCSTSRNYKFGALLAEGKGTEEAKREIGMVVEGAYTAVSALDLSRKLGVPMPITESVYKIVCEELDPREAVAALMSRKVKEEHL